MTITLILSGIIAPALFWMGYFYYKDRRQPEPLSCSAFSYLLGFGAAYIGFKVFTYLPYIGLPDDPSIIMENNPLLFFGYCVGVVGILEELLKFLPFVLVVLKFKAFDEKIDGIVYASTIALGFASFENLHYLVELEGLELFGRAIASPLTHTIFSSLWGYTAGVAYMTGKSLWKASIRGLLLAAFFHGIFDFFTFSPVMRSASSLIILIIWLWRIRVMEQMAEADNITGQTKGEQKTKFPWISIRD